MSQKTNKQTNKKTLYFGVREVGVHVHFKFLKEIASSTNKVAWIAYKWKACHGVLAVPQVQCADCARYMCGTNICIDTHVCRNYVNTPEARRLAYKMASTQVMSLHLWFEIKWMIPQICSFRIGWAVNGNILRNCNLHVHLLLGFSGDLKIWNKIN